MSVSVIEQLKLRGLLAQCTDEVALTQLLDISKNPPMTFYLGVDPSWNSLHVGHLVTLILCQHLKNIGHHPIIVIGGGTALVGDPSGKNTMRQLLQEKVIDGYAQAVEKQIRAIVSADIEILNNKDWLIPLNYIEFLRDIGKYFSVNRMLSFESYKQRLEKGLSFIEFNYQLMQSYDFLTLYRKKNCLLQVGGDDQFGNIVAGMDLIGRIEKVQTYGLTIPLLLTSDGKKMGKTEKQAIFLDANQTDPFEFYQYFRNVSDADVIPMLKCLTFLPLEQIQEWANKTGAQLNRAKEVLAYQVSSFVHGVPIAEQMQKQAQEFFQGSKENVPLQILNFQELELREAHDIFAIELFFYSGLTESKKEAKRLIEQGGASINQQKIVDLEYKMPVDSGPWLLQAGKKKFKKIQIETKGNNEEE